MGVNVHEVIPLRTDQAMAIISATLIINGEQLETANLFFNTFERGRESQEWKLVRSYIEAGVPLKNLQSLRGIPNMG
ncbi:hypothetical protein [Sediminibacillus albus]|uniref:SnoaL-like domain-containing protein n=1 Tax=Sediminibacillus albus TaxID=407036 RepID=A0A1G8VHE6_9BACI|nr:hypothetical protein [Sediminibacillus albus]SDJ65546.1 hypothetical protein SAMN05216243_0118 [Sediminibacillus albus]